MKKCKKCLQEKEENEFYKSSGNVCKECKKSARRERYHEVEKLDPNLVAENLRRTRVWIAEHRERSRANSRKWIRKPGNKERKRRYMKKYMKSYRRKKRSNT